MIYVDTSALMKLLRPEQGSDETTDFVRERDDLVSSTLLAVEIRRGVARNALLLGEELDELVTYDDRLADAAREQGITVVAPGA